MIAPLYQQHQKPDKRPEHAHSGLWFERFFDRFQKTSGEWVVPKPNQDQDAKRDWIHTVSGAVGDDAQLEAYQSRQSKLLQNIKGRCERYTNDWHFVTGMGNPHPVENGLTWHRTLGVPYLTGAAVKGLIRAWVEGNEDSLTIDEQKARLKLWFGSEAKGDIAEQAGGFIFFDAIPNQRPWLMCDIMTPHMGDWYIEGHKGDPSKLNAIPADWHEPVPVPFLVIKRTNLIFAIAPRQANLIAELDAVFTALTNALNWLGAGGKTAAGYGYFTRDKAFIEEQQVAAKQVATALAEQQRQAQLSPIELEIENFLKQIQLAEHDTRLLQELEKGTWQGGDAKVIAAKIQVLMEQNGKWMPDFSGTNDKKLKLKQRSLKVMQYQQG